MDNREKTAQWLLLAAVAVLLVWAIIAALSIEARADGLGQLKQDLVEQAAATAAAEGPTDDVPCYQVRRHGQTAVCITLEEWRRMHRDDRTALPPYRVGMRL